MMTGLDHTPHRRPGRVTALTPLLLAALIVSLAVVRSLTLSAELPTKLSDDEFWSLIHDASEPGGLFPSDNFVSNESSFQVVIPRLRETVEPGGVYLGVGPDQNFTYIAALKPAVAFIVDIRRQNLLHHLLYKALIELSPDREAFVERLFSRPRPRESAQASTTEQILDAALARAPDEVAYRRNLREALDRLRLVHGFSLSPEDQLTLDKVYSAFYTYGPEISYVSALADPISGPNRYGPSTRFPTYADLMVADDGQGTNWAYLGSEESYQAIRAMQLNNLIIPIVGDFAGSRALGTVGQWVSSRQAAVTTVYTSNVEQYLFQDDRLWMAYYTNVAALPTNVQSTFIRSHFPTPAFRINSMIAPGGHRIVVYPPPPATRNHNGFIESYSLLDPVQALLTAFEAGSITSYADVIRRSK